MWLYAIRDPCTRYRTEFASRLNPTARTNPNAIDRNVTPLSSVLQGESASDGGILELAGLDFISAIQNLNTTCGGCVPVYQKM